MDQNFVNSEKYVIFVVLFILIPYNMSRTRKDTRANNGFTNKQMNEAVYKERRQVMQYLYKAKNLLGANGIQMPRIEIRIVEADRSVTSHIGRARMGDCVVWMPSDALKTHGSKELYQIVLHELCHAIWGIDHNRRSKLMHPELQPNLSTKEAEEIFIRYAKKYS